jgi:hypothetical protein
MHGGTTIKSLYMFPEPYRTQFPQLVLPINSQLTTLRAPEVPSKLADQFTAHRERHSSVLAVSCLCHRHQVNETTNKCLFAKQNGRKCSLCGLILTSHYPNIICAIRSRFRLLQTYTLCLASKPGTSKLKAEVLSTEPLRCWRPIWWLSWFCNGFHGLLCCLVSTACACVCEAALRTAITVLWQGDVTAVIANFVVITQ